MSGLDWQSDSDWSWLDSIGGDEQGPKRVAVLVSEERTRNRHQTEYTRRERITLLRVVPLALEG